MLLLRGFFAAAFASIVELASAIALTVRFSFSMFTFGEGICAMDLRARGGARRLLGLCGDSIIESVS